MLFDVFLDRSLLVRQYVLAVGALSLYACSCGCKQIMLLFDVFLDRSLLVRQYVSAVGALSVYASSLCRKQIMICSCYPRVRL